MARLDADEQTPRIARGGNRAWGAWGALLVAIALLASCGGSMDGDAKRLLVIGMDGLDHQLMERWMNEGKLPNFARLRDAGGFRPLTTSIPPESPVAWSNVSRGMNPGGHGVKDFFKIDPAVLTNDEDVSPADGLRDSVSITEGELEEFGILGYKVPSPFGAPETINDADGTTFWQVLEKNGIPATVNRMPANFPPVPTKQRTLTGMGTPELSGATEAYALYTDNLPPNRYSLGGGKVYRVRPRNGAVKGTLYGPPQMKAPPSRKTNPTTTKPKTPKRRTTTRRIMRRLRLCRRRNSTSTTTPSRGPRRSWSATRS